MNIQKLVGKKLLRVFSCDHGMRGGAKDMTFVFEGGTLVMAPQYETDSPQRYFGLVMDCVVTPNNSKEEYVPNHV